jgi:hypothetical protein
MSRKPFIWDNRISNDSRLRTNYLFFDPSVGGWDLPADEIAGFAVNPMNQPHLSRIALCVYQRVFMYGPQQQDLLSAILRAPPPCHSSCRLDTSVICGALRNDSGSIQQRIQRTSSGSPAAA